MAKVLSSITVDAPASSVTASVDDTFVFTGTPTLSGGGGAQRYDFKWEVNNGGGYVTIGASGTGLITAGTNPLVNTNSQSANSITVACESAGSYTIRMAGAPTSGGAYTVLSATRAVEVSAPADITVTPGLASLTLTAQAPTVSTTDHRTLTPGAASLSLTAFTPTVEATSGGGATVVPGLATLELTAFEPTVSRTDHQFLTPGIAELLLSAFTPTVTKTDHVTVTPEVAVMTLTAFPVTVDNGDETDICGLTRQRTRRRTSRDTTPAW